MSFLDRIKSGLAKTRDALNKSLDPIFETLEKVDPTAPELALETVDSLEEALMAADVSMDSCERLMEGVKEARPRNREELLDALVDVTAKALTASPEAAFWPASETRPWVVLVIGVNGSGKTTLIGKMAAKETERGRKVMLVAADTFRAAAIEQLEIWAKRAGADLVSQRPGADPAAVAHDGISSALSKGIDTVIVDTAGRLHTHFNLMEELIKIKRVIGRLLPGAPHETLLVLDGTVGQNGIAQARQFHSSLQLTGLAINKLDGTARGGAVITVVEELGIPVRLVGLGEKISDLDDFEPRAYAEALVRG
jgi:fused signal recognition particle receptor